MIQQSQETSPYPTRRSRFLQPATRHQAVGTNLCVSLERSPRPTLLLQTAPFPSLPRAQACFRISLPAVQGQFSLDDDQTYSSALPRYTNSVAPRKARPVQGYFRLLLLGQHWRQAPLFDPQWPPPPSLEENLYDPPIPSSFQCSHQQVATQPRTCAASKDRPPEAVYP